MAVETPPDEAATEERGSDIGSFFRAPEQQAGEATGAASGGVREQERDSRIPPNVETFCGSPIDVLIRKVPLAGW